MGNGILSRLFPKKIPLYQALGIDKPRDDDLGIIALDIWSQSKDRAELIRLVHDNIELTTIEKMYLVSVFTEWLFE